MQKILISLLVILLSSLTLLFSQNSPWDCAMGTGISSNVFAPFSIATCIDDDYRGTDFNEDYIPDASTELLTLKVNLHIMQFSASDPRNYEEGNPAHQTELTQIMNEIRLRFNSNDLPTYEGQTNPSGFPTITDTRIRIDFTDVYYHQDNLGWSNNNSACGPYNFNNFAINEDCELNIFLIGADLPTDGCAGGVGPDPFVGEENNYIIFQPWTMASHFQPWDKGRAGAHEIGHRLGLRHPGNGGCGQFSDIYCLDINVWCN